MIKLIELKLKRGQSHNTHDSNKELAVAFSKIILLVIKMDLLL